MMKHRLKMIGKACQNRWQLVQPMPGEKLAARKNIDATWVKIGKQYTLCKKCEHRFFVNNG